MKRLILARICVSQISVTKKIFKKMKFLKLFAVIVADAGKKPVALKTTNLLRGIDP